MMFATGALDAPAKPDRRRDIQGLRAIAVGIVVAFHAGLPVPGGFVGVDIFFVISGFVITAMLSREWTATGMLSMRTFYGRRFRRLTPALALLVVVVVVVSALVQSPLGAQQTTALTGIGAVLLTANIVIARTTGGYFDAPAATNPLLNTWSLSVEEQFYLIFPLLLLVAWRLARRRRSGSSVPLAIIGGVGALSLAWALLESSGHRVPLLPTALSGFYGPITRVWEFAAGALLALVVARVAPALGRRAALSLAVVGAALVIASCWLVTDQTVWPGPMTLMPVIGTMALLAAGVRDNALSRVLGTRPFVAIGDLSYSWYLWHWPVIVFAVLLWPQFPFIALVAAAVSLIPSILSYRFLEQPIRGLRNVSAPRMARIVTLTLVPPVALGAALLIAADHGFWIPRVQQFVAAVSPMHVGNASGCNRVVAPASRNLAACTWHADAPNRPVYLVGDSHADHRGEALVGATGISERPLVIATANACPLYDVHLTSTAQPNSRCNEVTQKTLDWLAEQPAGTVVLSSSSIYWNSRTYAAGMDAASTTRDRAEKAVVLQAGLESTVRRLQDAGHDVVLVQDVPYFPPPLTSDPQQFSVRALAAGGDLAVRMPRADADRQQALPRAAIDAVAVATGAVVVDLRSYFCPDAECATQIGDLYLYRDDGHISVEASAALSAEFESVLAATR